MGWAVTYKVRLRQPLTVDETAALKTWSAANFPLETTRPDRAALDSWRGLVPDEVLEKVWKNGQPLGSDAKARDEGYDYAGFVQVRTDAQFRRVVRAFQELERLLSADILLADDYYLEDARPGSVDLRELVPLPARAESKPRPEPEPPREPSAAAPAVEPPVDPEVEQTLSEVEDALARARRDFALWKERKK
jgi:hypothetical protein